MQSGQKNDATKGGSQNKLKLRHFLQNNYNSKPILPSSVPISQLIRQYLNDDDFRILHQGVFVLPNQEYQKKLDQLYNQGLQKASFKQDVDQFLYFWFDVQPKLEVQYSLYDQINLQEKGFEVSAIFNRNKFQNKKIAKKIKFQGRAQSKLGVNEKSTISLKEQFTPLQLLKQFFIFYSKKQIDSIGNATFSRYQQYYNSINLGKWMNYVRDMAFLQFKKALSLQALKNIFIKHQNKDKCLTFQLFYDAVSKCLDIIYAGKKQIIETEGYELIGVRNLENFQQKFRALGLLPPIITKNKSKKQQNSSKINCNESFGSKVSIFTKLEQKSYTLKPKIKSQKIYHLSDVTNSIKILRKNQDSKKLKTKQTINNEPPSSQLNKAANSQRCLKNLRSNVKVKQNSRLIEELMELQQADPYLKRYNNKQSVENYHCLMNRIDERVQKMCNKY